MHIDRYFNYSFRAIYKLCSKSCHRRQGDETTCPFQQSPAWRSWRAQTPLWHSCHRNHFDKNVTCIYFILKKCWFYCELLWLLLVEVRWSWSEFLCRFEAFLKNWESGKSFPLNLWSHLSVIEPSEKHACILMFILYDILFLHSLSYFSFRPRFSFVGYCFVYSVITFLYKHLLLIVFERSHILKLSISLKNTFCRIYKLLFSIWWMNNSLFWLSCLKCVLT